MASLVLRIQRASYPQPRFLHDVRVNLGGADIRMAQKVLHGADIGTALQQLRRKTVSQHMGRDPFVELGLMNKRWHSERVNTTGIRLPRRETS